MIAEDNYNVIITPSDATITANRSLTLNAKVTNNGVDDLAKEIGFEVTNADGSNNPYVTYSINGNTITINASSTYNKVVNIKAYMKSNTTIYEIRRLSIISLL
jgi:alkaline phosphatase